jgi:hypothetical protein
VKRRPSICFDTAICINAAKGTYPNSEWRTVWKFVAAKFDYAITPLVIMELILGIAQGDETHFARNQAALKILYPTHKKRFLPMPGTFVLKTLLGFRSTRHPSSPENFERQTRIAISASSKEELVSNRVPFPGSRKYVGGIDLDFLRSQMKEGQRLHVTSLERLRNRELLMPRTRSDWAKDIFSAIKDDLTDAECERVAAHLDAAYQYHRFLWNEAVAGRYVFSKHGSDWIDSFLLFYLVDPSIHLLVHDRNLKSRIAGSPQSDRVHGYADFVKLATA